MDKRQTFTKHVKNTETQSSENKNTDIRVCNFSKTTGTDFISGILEKVI